MPGVFAPTLPESGTAIQPQAPIPGVDYSGVAKSVFGALDGVLNPSDNSTQKERDNKLLQGFAREQTRFFKGRDSLGLRYRSSVKDSFNKFIEQNPAYASEANEIIKSVHGEAMDVKNEFDAAAIKNRNMIEYATNDEKGRRILERSITFTNGVYDVRATMDKFSKSYHEEMAFEYDMENRRREKESRDLSEDEKKAMDKETSDKLLTKHLAELTDSVDNFLGNIERKGLNFNRASDIEEIMKALDETILKYEQRFRSDAIEKGIAADYDMEKALAPLIRMKTFLENNRENISKNENALTAENRVKMGRLMQKLSGLPQLGTDPEFFKWMDNTALVLLLEGEKSVDEIVDFFKSEVAKEREVFSDNIDLFDSPLEDPAPTAEGEASEGVEAEPANTPFEAGDIFNPTLVEEIGKLSTAQRLSYLGMLQTTVEKFDLGLVNSDENYRNLVAGDLTKLLATAFVNNGGTVTGPDVVDAYLTPKVIQAYKAIVKQDPVVGARLQKSIAFVFNNNIESRAAMIESRNNSNIISRPLQWAVGRNDRIELVYKMNDPNLDEPTKKYLRAATAAGYDLSVQSLREFDESLRGTRTETLFKIRGNLHVSLGNELQKMNKINALLRQKFPEIGTSSQWRKALASRFTSKADVTPVVDASKFSSPQDIIKLGPGTYILDWGEEQKKVTVTADGKVLQFKGE